MFVIDGVFRTTIVREQHEKGKDVEALRFVNQGYRRLTLNKFAALAELAPALPQIRKKFDLDDRIYTHSRV